MSISEPGVGEDATISTSGGSGSSPVDQPSAPDTRLALEQGGNGDGAVRALSATPPKTKSLQDLPKGQTVTVLGGAADKALMYLMTVVGQQDCVPAYGTRGRDQWLADFVKQEGNDLLAGAVSTVAAKIGSTSWYVEGPLELATLVRHMLLYWSDGARGWDSLILKWCQSYLVRDSGGTIELLRASARDLDGPALGYRHLDESKCVLSGDDEYPLVYHHRKGTIKVHRSQVARIVDMPNPEVKYKGSGWCSTSRAITTALTLMDIVRYKRERLSDLPAAGLLILNNLGPAQWKDITERYDTRQVNQGNTVWRDVMTVLGVDPAYPTSAEFVNFAELPEHFNEKEAVEIVVYSFALAFREDPREFWPVSAGPLGTGTEAELQARKARGKGEGIIYVAIERQLNRPDCLPPNVTFHFDFQDDEEDELQATIRNLKTQWIRRLWEASPNRQFGVPSAGVEPGEQGKRPPAPEGEEEGASEGIISTEQAQQLLVWENVIPAQILGLSVEADRLYDTRTLSYGPRTRLYRDGECVRLAQ